MLSCISSLSDDDGNFFDNNGVLLYTDDSVAGDNGCDSYNAFGVAGDSDACAHEQRPGVEQRELLLLYNDAP